MPLLGQLHGFESSDDESEDGVLPGNVPALNLDWIDPSDFRDRFLPRSLALSELPGYRFRSLIRSLPQDLATLQQNGITDVICLLTKAELQKYKVSKLFEEYDRHGICYEHFPILDGYIPDMCELEPLVNYTLRLLEHSRKVLIHCFAGLGRTGLIAACILMSLDDEVTPSEVIEKLRTVRGPRTIQSVKQYNFVWDYRVMKEEYLKQEEEDQLSR